MVSVLSEPRADIAAPIAETAPAAVRIDRVSMRYPVGRKHEKLVLDGIDLEIAEGEFVVLLGETGCGKSTLLRMILGQERPTEGTIHVGGTAVTRVNARCGYVPQRYSLFPDRTVLGNLMMGPETSRAHILGRLRPGFRAFRREVRAEAMRQLEAMGLRASDAGKYPHQLSGGMQQRVAIAQTLMMQSRVLLMDEAFSALDPATRSSLQQLIRAVWSERRPTVVFVTHNTAEALFLGTRLIVLARTGRGEECGASVALDMRLPESGMSLARHGTEFLEMVDYVERVSRGTHRPAAGDEAL